MKKIILLLICALTGTFNLFAQAGNPKAGESKLPRKAAFWFYNILGNQFRDETGKTVAKPTGGEKQRVIAYSYYEQTGLSDTFRYTYSGERGSFFNHNQDELTYNYEYTSKYLPDSVLSYFDNPLDLLADSIIQTMEAGQATSNWAHAFFRSDNKVDSFDQIHNWGGNPEQMSIHHSFNLQGHLTQIIALNYGDTIGWMKYFYTPDGNTLLTDTAYYLSGGSYQPANYEIFHHNNEGLLDTILGCHVLNGSEFVDSRQAFFYDNAHRLVKQNYFEYDPFANGHISVMVFDSLSYTDDLRFYTFLSERSGDNSGIAYLKLRIRKTVGSNNLPDSVIRTDYYGVDTITQNAKFYYNSFNNPDSVRSAIDDGTFPMKFTFYYELYGGSQPNGIGDIKENKAFCLYPNPLKNRLNIVWNGRDYAASIRLIDVSGKLLYSIEKILKSGVNAIEIPNLRSGNYVLLLRDDEGKEWTTKITVE